MKRERERERNRERDGGLLRARILFSLDPLLQELATKKPEDEKGPRVDTFLRLHSEIR